MMFMQVPTKCRPDWHIRTTRNMSLAVWLLLIFTGTSTAADAGLHQSECLNSLVEEKPPTLCLSSTMGHLSCERELCLGDKAIFITGFLLHIPITRWSIESCDVNTLSKFNYNSTMNSSCLTKTSLEAVKKLMLPIMEGFSGKRSSDINSSLIAQNLIDNKLYGLPENTLLSLDYRCLNRETMVIPILNICDNKNMTDQVMDRFYVGYSMMPDSSNLSSSVCSCVVKSAQNNSSRAINIRAIDVRLAGGATLSLIGTETKKVLEQSTLYWWEDDVLLSSQGEVGIKLAEINPQALPHSVWLHVTGQDLTFSCGNYSWQNSNMTVSDDSPFTNSWIFLYLGIVVGTLILILLGVFLCRCLCRRMHRKYDIVKTGSTALKVKSASRRNEPTQHEDESSDKYMHVSNVYFEVEPKDSEEAQASGSNINHFKDARDLNGSMGTNHQDNIYSHLREATATNPSSDLYDTLHCDEYSTLQRKEPKNVIDNVYNT